LTNYRPLPIVLVAILALGTFLAPMPDAANPKTAMVLALTVLIIGLMATNGLPEFQVSALYFSLALVFQAAPAEVVLSSLRSSAFWLIAGGVVIGIAAIKTGLGRRVAEVFVRHLSQSYPRLIAGIVFGAVVLAFLIPAAIARMIILMPIVLALADRLGFQPGSKGRTGMALAVGISSFYIPMTILPSNFPNVLLAGMAERIYGIKITYGEYLLMHFPVAGALKALLLVGVICWLFNDRVPDATPDQPPPPALGAEGKRLAAIIVVTVGMWATDFIHGIAPGWIAVVAAGICLLPGLGVISVMDVKGRSSGFIALFNVATVISLGAVIAQSGAGELIVGKLFAAADFRPGEPGYTYGIFSAINIALTFIATLPGTIAVLAPFAGSIADSASLPVMTVLMIIANGYCTVFLPYQAPPIIAGLRLGGVGLADGSKLTVTLSLLTVLILLPLTYLWWRTLGYFG
jgi:di/tricarboxylate transporter